MFRKTSMYPQFLPPYTWNAVLTNLQNFLRFLLERMLTFLEKTRFFSRSVKVANLLQNALQSFSFPETLCSTWNVIFRKKSKKNKDEKSSIKKLFVLEKTLCSFQKTCLTSWVDEKKEGGSRSSCQCCN